MIPLVNLLKYYFSAVEPWRKFSFSAGINKRYVLGALFLIGGNTLWHLNLRINIFSQLTKEL